MDINVDLFQCFKNILIKNLFCLKTNRLLLVVLKMRIHNMAEQQLAEELHKTIMNDSRKEKYHHHL